MPAAAIFAAILALIGAVLLFIALLSGGACLLALIDRLQYGRGIMFADAEFFGLIAIVLALPGGLAVLGARKLSKRKQPTETGDPVNN